MFKDDRARSTRPGTAYEPVDTEGRRRTGDWLDAQHEFPVDSVAGEPIEPGLEDRRSLLRDSGEPGEPPGGPEMPELRNREAEPERHLVAAEADPPEGQ